jgi:glycosyltransferase involved in cell wall biosynthesis
MNPKVSVVIPTHARPRQDEMLERALRSALGQTYTKVEVLVVENGLPNGTSALLRRLWPREPRLRYLYQSEASAALARNAGVQAARGAYIAFLDDDDEWLPTKLERQVEVLERFPDVGVVSCRASVMTRLGAIIGEQPKFRGHPSLDVLVAQGCVIPTMSCAVVRRGCFDQAGFFDGRYRIVHDFEFYLRVARVTRCMTLDEPLVRYHAHEGNLTRQAVVMWQEMTAATSTIQPSREFGVGRHALRAALRRYRRNLSHAHYRQAADAFDAKHYRDATRAFWRAVCLDPAVGLAMPGGRFQHPAYRALRPYFAVGYCVAAAFVRWTPDGRGVQ